MLWRADRQPSSQQQQQDNNNNNNNNGCVSHVDGFHWWRIPISLLPTRFLSSRHFEKGAHFVRSFVRTAACGGGGAAAGLLTARPHLCLSKWSASEFYNITANITLITELLLVLLLVLPWCHPSILQQLSNWKPVITLKTLNPKPPGLCMVIYQ